MPPRAHCATLMRDGYSNIPRYLSFFRVLPTPIEGLDDAHKMRQARKSPYSSVIFLSRNNRNRIQRLKLKPSSFDVSRIRCGVLDLWNNLFFGGTVGNLMDTLYKIEEL
ncbi:hypothetical protein JTE90_017831 [Oedothorax gibbosus]|uniref:Uncharacterized protein n=1 Tax=Oedothorax gibbosus TaxID=931172 RepID=A0AAV6V8M2_9ARAC|nr:hypothetical protein JTE90_017831 [Oedothorax gibbosus]